MGRTFISWCSFAALLLPQVLAAAAAGPENEMAAPLMPRQDGACGPGYSICPMGECCSQFGFCGTTSEFCGAGCQPSYGSCSPGGGQSSAGSMTTAQHSPSVVTVTRSGCTSMM